MFHQGYVSIMEVNLHKRSCRLHKREDLLEKQGGSGLAAALYKEYGQPQDDAFAPDQPLIFAIGPLTGIYPLMNKAVLGFKSPYSGHYAETHAGGRFALALRFSGIDALVIHGEAEHPVYLTIGKNEFAVNDARHLWGMDTTTTARTLRNSEQRGRGHRSIIRIGPAGEKKVRYAGINVDTFRHFGRLGAGAVMGAKKLKALILLGNGSFPLDFPHKKNYQSLYRDIHEKATTSSVMKKYHDLGTPVNVLVLNKMKSLPTKNLQQTCFAGAEGISGEYFAQKLLLRQTACSGCPVGCIHIAMMRHKFGPEHEYYYKQVGYDHEPIFAMGSMLGVSPAESVMSLLEEAEKTGLDVISAGVALAWATEAFEKGIISEKETIIKLEFGDGQSYQQALRFLASRENDFYCLLGEGTLTAAEHYGGEEFACVLGQEMAGYATGAAYFVSQALGFRISHLDTAGYQLDQSEENYETEHILTALQKEENLRFMLTSQVACLFARNIYDYETVGKALEAIGLVSLAEGLEKRSSSLCKERWQVKKQTGFDPCAVQIPRRFYEIETLRGKISAQKMNDLLKAYAAVIAGY